MTRKEGLLEPGRIRYMGVMFQKVLIANRGEIARRVIRTCKRLGVLTVAVYSEADRAAPHVTDADEAICVGPPPAKDSYLNVDALLAAVTKSGADWKIQNDPFAGKVEWKITAP